VPSLPSPSPSLPQRPVRVFLPCTGLGRQRRGFETFTLQCADALRADPRIALSSFLPALVLGRPDVVYFADLNLGNLCWHWRRLSGQRFKLLYYNGGLTTRPFTRADMVRQLTPAGLDEAVARGEAREHRTVLPHGETRRAERHASARTRFGWDALREDYARLLLRVAEMPA